MVIEISVTVMACYLPFGVTVYWYLHYYLAIRSSIIRMIKGYPERS